MLFTVYVSNFWYTTSCAVIWDINWICMIFVKFPLKVNETFLLLRFMVKRIHFANNVFGLLLSSKCWFFWRGGGWGGSQLEGDNEIKSRMSWGPSVLPDTDSFIYRTIGTMPIIINIIILWQVPISCWQALLISLHSFAVGIYPRQQPPWRRENGTEKKYVTLKTVQVVLLQLLQCTCGIK